MIKQVLAGMVVLTLTAAPSFAARHGKTAKTKAADDQTFMIKAAKGGMAEVQLGQLAADKGTSDEVKKFGQRMVTDHSKANDELKTLAQSKHITLPSEIDPKDKALHDRLANLSGAAFDRAYMRNMVADHKTDIAEFRMESKGGKDPDVKAWAEKTLPTLEDHLKQAQDANRAVGTSGRK
jgi:putative membrane protein